MSTVEEIEAAVRSLPMEKQFELAQRLHDVLWDVWDRQIEDDAKSGRLDHILGEVEADITSGKTKPLDEVLDNS